MVHLLRVVKGVCSEETNVGCSNVLDLLVLSAVVVQSITQSSQEDLRRHTRSKVIHERHGPQDRPAHLTRILLQVLLNLELCLEMSNRSLVVPALLVTTTLNA